MMDDGTPQAGASVPRKRTREEQEKEFGVVRKRTHIEDAESEGNSDDTSDEETHNGSSGDEESDVSSEESDDDLYLPFVGGAATFNEWVCGGQSYEPLSCVLCRTSLHLGNYASAGDVNVCRACHKMCKQTFIENKRAGRETDVLSFVRPPRGATDVVPSHVTENDDERAELIKERVFAAKERLARNMALPLAIKQEALRDYFFLLRYPPDCNSHFRELLRLHGFLQSSDEGDAWEFRPSTDAP